MSQSQPPPDALEFPQPPSFKDTQSDPAATLAWLKKNIATIYLTGRTTSPSGDKPPTLARGAYLGVYTTTHNYVEITKHAYKRRADDLEPLNGEDLYRGLEEITRSHCSQVRTHIFTIKNDNEANGNASHAMIREYLAQWKMLTQHLAALIAHLLRHLDRVWIRRELDEKRKVIYSIEELHTVVWKEEILLQVGGDSTTTAATTARSELKQALETLLQEQGQDEVETDGKKLAVRFLESLKTVGVDLEAPV